MYIYNALTQTKEPFAAQGDTVSVYVCGITPYDTTHLGHMFTYASFDTLIRYLEFQGHTVHYVQNVTDIDDDILRKAKEVGENWQALVNRWTAHFIRDLKELNVRPPDHYPRATGVIGGIITIVEQLLAAGVAYQANGSVYFQVAKWPEFGELSRLDYPEMLSTANERGNNPNDPNKRDPLDFVLWQAQAPGEPAWDSPWGLGRPGWHIECTAMSTRFLGLPIDFHGGGGDLIFPHHECEIAQSEAGLGERPFVRFWMHTAMVRHEGEKMSKSLGNLIMIRDLLNEGWRPNAIRLYLANHHYREAWSHSAEELAQAAQLAESWEAAVKAPSGSGEAMAAKPFADAFSAALDDDLDSPAAVGVLTELAEAILAAGERGQDVRNAKWKLRTRSAIFGVCLSNTAEERVTTGWDRHLQNFLP
jgi:L-cysteine:1D-myo-inositol 2-amino-2-deoxy-alpha-D-glucopyranoside ligase